MNHHLSQRRPVRPHHSCRSEPTWKYRNLFFLQLLIIKCLMKATICLVPVVAVLPDTQTSDPTSSFSSEEESAVIDLDITTDVMEMNLDNDNEKVIHHENHEQEGMDDKAGKENDFIKTFYSIDEFYNRLQEQQQSAPPTYYQSSIYWTMLMLQDDECSASATLRTDTSNTVETLYQEAAKQLQLWNQDWYANDTSRVLDDSRIEGSSTNGSMDVPYIHVGQFYLQSDEDKEIIISQLGIVTTPTIVLVSTQIRSNNTTTAPQTAKATSETKAQVLKSTEYGPLYVIEYTGIASTSIGMAHGIRHYFDTISDLRSQPIHAQSSYTTNATSPLVLIEPRHFSSIHHLQQYILTYYHRLFPNDAASCVNEFGNSVSNRLVLSKEKTSPEERLYIHWLLDDVNIVNDDAAAADFVLLIVQCRTKEPEGSKNPKKQQDLYEDFDTMARTLQARRDTLFFVAQQPVCNFDGQSEADCWCTSDGSVYVYEIPSQHLNKTDSMTLLSKPTTEWATLFVSYYFDSGNELLKNDENIAAKKSRLVEFLVKVCTDSVLWFDRQLVAPIAFPIYRKIHAVLFIDMHYENMQIVTETFQHKVEAAFESNDFIARNTTPLLDDNPRSLMNRRSVSDFRRACRKHRLRYRQSLLDYDMVCLIVPSTETRILTTFGITELWSTIDASVESFTPDVLRQLMQQHSDDATTQNDSIALPRLLIMDQREGGTQHYSKNLVPGYTNANVSRYNPIDAYLTKFWNHELNYIVKSGPTPKNEINQYGVHILTANTIISKLYNPTESTATTSNSSDHALVLFTTSTCGHCKRISAIWNRLGRLLHNIGWEKLVQLYQIDVSENDIMNTPLNVTIEWVPDVYYLSPDRKKRIRYSIVDELGDTIGSIRHPIEMIDWLIHGIGNDFMNTKGVEQLLNDLEKH